MWRPSFWRRDRHTSPTTQIKRPPGTRAESSDATLCRGRRETLRRAKSRQAAAGGRDTSSESNKAAMSELSGSIHFQDFRVRASRREKADASWVRALLRALSARRPSDPSLVLESRSEGRRAKPNPRAGAVRFITFSTDVDVSISVVPAFFGMFSATTIDSKGGACKDASNRTHIATRSDARSRCIQILMTIMSRYKCSRLQMVFERFDNSIESCRTDGFQGLLHIIKCSSCSYHTRTQIYHVQPHLLFNTTPST